MRRVEVLSVEDPHPNKQLPANTPFEHAIINRSIVVTYSGNEIETLKGKKCVRQMPDLVAPVGYDILFLPAPGSPPIVPALVSTDVWRGEVILEFIDDHVSLCAGDPLAMAMAVPRCETVVRSMTPEEFDDHKNKKDYLINNRKLIATRSENHDGFIVDNAYEVIVKNAKPVGQPAFFRRVIK